MSDVLAGKVIALFKKPSQPGGLAESKIEQYLQAIQAGGNLQYRKMFSMLLPQNPMTPQEREEADKMARTYDFTVSPGDEIALIDRLTMDDHVEWARQQQNNYTI